MNSLWMICFFYLIQWYRFEKRNQWKNRTIGYILERNVPTEKSFVLHEKINLGKVIDMVEIMFEKHKRKVLYIEIVEQEKDLSYHKTK